MHPKTDPFFPSSPDRTVKCNKEVESPLLQLEHWAIYKRYQAEASQRCTRDVGTSPPPIPPLRKMTSSPILGARERDSPRNKGKHFKGVSFKDAETSMSPIHLSLTDAVSVHFSSDDLHSPSSTRTSKSSAYIDAAASPLESSSADQATDVRLTRGRDFSRVKFAFPPSPANASMKSNSAHRSSSLPSSPRDPRLSNSRPLTPADQETVRHQLSLPAKSLAVSSTSSSTPRSKSIPSSSSSRSTLSSSKKLSSASAPPDAEKPEEDPSTSSEALASPHANKTSSINSKLGSATLNSLLSNLASFTSYFDSTTATVSTTSSISSASVIKDDLKKELPFLPTDHATSGALTSSLSPSSSFNSISSTSSTTMTASSSSSTITFAPSSATSTFHDGLRKVNVNKPVSRMLHPLLETSVSPPLYSSPSTLTSPAKTTPKVPSTLLSSEHSVIQQDPLLRPHTTAQTKSTMGTLSGEPSASHTTSLSHPLDKLPASTSKPPPLTTPLELFPFRSTTTTSLVTSTSTSASTQKSQPPLFSSSFLKPNKKLESDSNKKGPSYTLLNAFPDFPLRKKPKLSDEASSSNASVAFPSSTLPSRVTNTPSAVQSSLSTKLTTSSGPTPQIAQPEEKSFLLTSPDSASSALLSTRSKWGSIPGDLPSSTTPPSTGSTTPSLRPIEVENKTVPSSSTSVLLSRESPSSSTLTTSSPSFLSTATLSHYPSTLSAGVPSISPADATQKSVPSIPEKKIPLDILNVPSKPSTSTDSKAIAHADFKGHTDPEPATSATPKMPPFMSTTSVSESNASLLSASNYTSSITTNAPPAATIASETSASATFVSNTRTSPFPVSSTSSFSASTISSTLKRIGNDSIDLMSSQGLKQVKRTETDRPKPASSRQSSQSNSFLTSKKEISANASESGKKAVSNESSSSSNSRFMIKSLQAAERAKKIQEEREQLRRNRFIRPAVLSSSSNTTKSVSSNKVVDTPYFPSSNTSIPTNASIPVSTRAIASSMVASTTLPASATVSALATAPPPTFVPVPVSDPPPSRSATPSTIPATPEPSFKPPPPAASPIRPAGRTTPSQLPRTPGARGIRLDPTTPVSLYSPNTMAKDEGLYEIVTGQRDFELVDRLSSKIPKWALEEPLNQALFEMDHVDADTIFGNIDLNSLKVLFSSAYTARDESIGLIRLNKIEEEHYKKFMGFL